METVKSLEEYGSLIKAGTETIDNEAKEQKSGFFDILLGYQLLVYWEVCAASRSNKSK